MSFYTSLGMGKNHFSYKPVFYEKIFVKWLRTQETPITGSLGRRQKCQRVDGKQALRGCFQKPAQTDQDSRTG